MRQDHTTEAYYFRQDAIVVAVPYNRRTTRLLINYPYKMPLNWELATP